MRKQNCPNCGTPNFEAAHRCFKCRQPILDSPPAAPSNFRTAKSVVKSGRFDTSTFVFLGIVLVALSVGSFIGYRRYSAWKKEKAEIAELEKFTKTAFKNDPDKVKNAIEKEIPTRFRISPPDLSVLNAFPFRDELVRKKSSEVIGEKNNRSERICGPGFPVSGPGSCSVGEITHKNIFSKQSETRMIGAVKIDGYRYSKDPVNNLTVDVRFIAEIETLVNDDGDFGACGYNLTNEKCVTKSNSERWAIMRLVRSNDAWEIVSVELEDDGFNEAKEIETWTKETDGQRIAASWPDLVPNKILGYFPLNEGDISKLTRTYAFYGKRDP